MDNNTVKNRLIFAFVVIFKGDDCNRSWKRVPGLSDNRYLLLGARWCKMSKFGVKWVRRKI